MARDSWLVLAAVVVCGCSQPSPERQIVEDSADALGGRNRVVAVKTLTLEGEGTNGNLGQDMTPEAASQTFTVTGYRRLIDVVGRRVRLEQTRTPTFMHFQGPDPQRQIVGLDGDIPYAIAANGNATRAADAVARDRRMEFYHHPITIVRAALDPAAQLGNSRTFDGQHVVSVTTADGFTLTLATDAATNLPTSVTSMTYHANLGDVAIETKFADYQAVDGLRLPAALTTKTDQYTTAAIRLTRQAVDGDLGDVAAPPSAAAAQAISGPPTPNVTVEEVARGVWLLGGQSHHTVVVEFSDHLKMIEAPQNEARTLAVIARARELRPGKPLTHVINTHHHFDHSAGIRAAVSEGLTVVTHQANAAYFVEAAKRSHAITPDALARSPKPIKVETVGDGVVYKDAAMTMVLYHVEGSGHGDAILMAYLPRERLIVEVDVYGPGAAIQPYAANFLDNIRRRNLRVDRIVPLHGRIGSYEELVKAVGPASSPRPTS
jgi:glyoxylase-like metal-dependent hydrolase (beta-lactamase superfamily II)